MARMEVLDASVTVIGMKKEDYISLTDIAKHKSPSDANEIIRNWLRNRNTIEYLGIWEKIYNPDFKPVEFDGFKFIKEKILIEHDRLPEIRKPQ